MRNVALRKVYFHNGSFSSLEAVVRFYATRDTSPQTWYAGRKFDDQPGGKPALSEREIADIVAFLQTLSDGYSGVRSNISTQARR